MMKKRIIAALLVFLIAVCGIIALYGHTLHVSSSVSGGSLYAVRDGDAAVYDGASRSMRVLPVDQQVYDMCSADDGNIWLLASSGKKAELLLWDGAEVVRTVPLNFRPLAVRAYQNGVLLVRRQSREQLTPYLIQGYSMLSVTADVLYLDTKTLEQTKKAECSFPQKSSAQGSFFAVHGDLFTFLSPKLQLRDASFISDDRSVCVCSADGAMREIRLPQEAEIRDLISGSDGFAAVGRKGLYAFSAEDGLGNKLLTRRNLPSGVISSDGNYYMYTKKNGLFSDTDSLYAVRISGGITVRLFQKTISEDSLASILYFV